MPGDASRENGKRGGRPKGSRSKATLEREAVLAAFRERAMRIADILLDSQLTLAKGQTFLYKIEKEKVKGPKGGISYQRKRPELVTDQWEIESYLEGLIEEGDADNDQDPGATYYFITTKEPNNMAIDSILDRTFGKSVSRTELSGPGGKDLIPQPLLENLRKNVPNNNSVKKDNSPKKKDKGNSGWDERSEDD
jgi:hypothetical protein